MHNKKKKKEIRNEKSKATHDLLYHTNAFKGNKHNKNYIDIPPTICLWRDTDESKASVYKKAGR